MRSVKRTAGCTSNLGYISGTISDSVSPVGLDGVVVTPSGGAVGTQRSFVIYVDSTIDA